MSSAINKRHSVEELKTIVKPVAEKHGVDRIYLFGSVARGDHNEDSDYDFCIEKGRIRDMFAFAEFFQDMYDAVGHEIDILTTKTNNTELLDRIKTEWVVVYE